MPGPNSCPNGDTRLVRGHINEEFACAVHGQNQLAVCEENASDPEKACNMMPLRWYLSQRNMLRTGKTK